MTYLASAPLTAATCAAPIACHGSPWYKTPDICSYEELAGIARVFVALGVRKIRLTGGEPLVRKDLTRLMAMLHALDPDLELCLTTNGLLLRQHLDGLMAAGLQRVNLSLDSFDPDRFRAICGEDGLDEVLAALDALLASSVRPVKINCVLMRGVNDDEIGAFARLARDKPVGVRFIEYMPYGNTDWSVDKVIPIAEVVDSLTRTLPGLAPLETPPGQVARLWKAPGMAGDVGIISAVSDHFCDACNKVRVDARGQLRTCLFGPDGADLRGAWREGGEAAVEAAVLAALALKPEGHEEFTADAHYPQHMSKIGVEAPAVLSPRLR